MGARLLWIEDDAALRRLYRPLLESAGFSVHEARDPGAARLAWQAEPPELVLLDLMLPPRQDPKDGLGLLDELLAAWPGIKVVVLSGAGGQSVALEAVRRGAHDMLGKPVDPDVLLVVLERARHLLCLEAEVRRLRARAPQDGVVVGVSPAILKAWELLDRAAPSEIPVSLSGEPGTGKEVFARRLHEGSRRRERPFVAVNCGAIPPGLVESHLFGHEKGAFTGADRASPGLFQEAHGGTLFLDEVGELEAAVQVALLRVLESGEIRPVGARGSRTVDVRLVSATNRDLGALVKQGQFREDLYWRLRGLEICLPPLRERGEDIIRFSEYFLGQLEGMLGEGGRGSIPVLGESAKSALLAHDWPGNLRELRHAVQRGALLAAGHAEIMPEDLGLSTQRSAQPMEGSLAEAVVQLERRLIQEALERTGGNRSLTARELGLSRQGLLNKLARYRLEKYAQP